MNFAITWFSKEYQLSQKSKEVEVELMIQRQITLKSFKWQFQCTDQEIPVNKLE